MELSDQKPRVRAVFATGGASHTLGFLGAAFGAPVVPLGVDGFGQSGTIGDLYRYFLHARRLTRKQEQGLALYNLLEEIVIRRTRPFVRRAYPEATIRGKVIRFPERKLRTVQYDL